MSNKKTLFFIAAVLWFVMSRVFISANHTLEYWGATALVYTVGMHWVYAFIFNADMHNHLGKIKPNESPMVRKLSFYVGLMISLYVTVFV